jgi:tetratricopeptide (TPR) repeat protein
MVGLLASLAYARNADYRAPIVLWKDTTEKMPQNARGHLNYALELMDKKSLSEQDLLDAAAEFTEAIRLKPDYTEGYYNRAIAYDHIADYDKQNGDMDRAVQLYWQAIADYTQALKPKENYQYLYNRGNVYVKVNRHDLAMADYNRAIELHPDFPIYSNRAALFYLHGEYDKAWADIRMCRKLGGIPKENLLRDLIRNSGRTE